MEFPDNSDILYELSAGKNTHQTWTKNSEVVFYGNFDRACACT